MEVVRRVLPGNILTVFVEAEMLDLVLDTCNYDAAGEGVILVDADQLENTSDRSGLITKLLQELNQAALDWHKSLGSESINGQYQGLILLRC